MAAPAPRHLGWGYRFLAVAFLAAVLSPLVTDVDGFPLSTYPMYAWRRPRVETFTTVVGVDAAGTVRRLSLATIAQTDDPLLAEATIAQAVDGGRADRLCDDVAGRAGEGIVRIEVVEERRDVVDEAAGRPSLEGRTVKATCEVAR